MVGELSQRKPLVEALALLHGVLVPARRTQNSAVGLFWVCRVVRVRACRASGTTHVVTKEEDAGLTYVAVVVVKELAPVGQPQQSTVLAPHERREAEHVS